MKRLCILFALAMSTISCGWLGNNNGNDVENGEVQASGPAMDVDVEAMFRDADVEAMTIEQRVDHYLSRYAHESSLEDRTQAETTYNAMMEWLQSLSDDDKRRADDASEAWYSKNADRL
ncbi:MAG: hypothetical protein J6Q95_04845 [Alistipes sp.]|nr:hypothetical protein [Alistipes sp.]